MCITKLNIKYYMFLDPEQTLQALLEPGQTVICRHAPDIGDLKQQANVINDGGGDAKSSSAAHAQPARVALNVQPMKMHEFYKGYIII